MKAIVVADGDVPSSAPVPALLAARDGTPPLVVAADGGALKAELLGLLPDVIVGDLDSLAPQTQAEFEARGVELQRHPAAKDESDTELAVGEALRRGATELLILGALGGLRFDHSLANVLLLTLPALDGVDAALADGTTTVRVIGGDRPTTLTIEGQPGDLVSLLPLSEEVSGVVTSGLRYPLADEPLRQGPARGVSNVLEAEQATVSARAGRLAIVHTRNGGKAARNV